MQTYPIHTFTYEPRNATLGRLTHAVETSGGWIVDRKTLSADTALLVFELQLRSILDLYSALAAGGIEFGRQSRDTLAHLCAGRNHPDLRTHASGLLTIRLEVRFLEDAPLPMILASTLHVV